MAHTDAHKPVTEEELSTLWDECISVKGGHMNDYVWNKEFKSRYHREERDARAIRLKERISRHKDNQLVRSIVRDVDRYDDAVFADHRHDEYRLPSY